jgi:homogentisate 1,2-dioxygenase
VASWKGASEADLKPQKIADTMAFMVESRWIFSPTDHALKTSALDEDYDLVWQGFPKADVPRP